MDGVLEEPEEIEKNCGWLPGMEKPGREFCIKSRLKLGYSITVDDNFYLIENQIS